ncbi:saccharopine dehydrogenase family protein [Bradyrhizobium sp. 2TAF24]|uniref:saccharopine dehydrogenase family protein n=1 Tax=Bradyrhizobium sp. 2TAF24 TaxID=3233011 RepID=UPI003F927C46
MRVVVLGGAGGMGRTAVRVAAELGFVREVVVADRHLAGAEQVAARHRGKARPAHVDVRDMAALAAVLDGATVVMNASGPFFELGVPVLEAVIAAGAHYLDICDDWEPTLQMLALDAKARARGVTAIVGMGASPGLTNLLAVAAARTIERPLEILTGWSIDGVEDAGGQARAPSDEPSAAVVHWMQQLSGKIRVHNGGASVLVKPLQRREIDFPGHGRLAVWSVGHPEAVTLPRVFGGLQACTNVMAGSDERTFAGLRVLQTLVDRKILSLKEAAREIEKPDGKASAKPAGAAEVPSLFGWVRGETAGRPVIAAAWLRGLPAGGMSGATGVPLGLALHRFAAERPPAGVVTPEEAIDPAWFFDLFAPFCGFGSGADLVARGELPLGVGA